MLAREEFAPGREDEIVLAAVAAEERFGDVAAQEHDRFCSRGAGPKGESGDGKDAGEPTHGPLRCSGKRAPPRRSPRRALAPRGGAGAAPACRTRRARTPASSAKGTARGA